MFKKFKRDKLRSLKREAREEITRLMIEIERITNSVGFAPLNSFDNAGGTMFTMDETLIDVPVPVIPKTPPGGRWGGVTPEDLARLPKVAPAKKPTTTPMKQRVATEATVATSQNDYSMSTKGLTRINATADIDITGIANGSIGRMAEVMNTSTTSKIIRLPHEDTGSIANNRITIPNGATVKGINVPPGSIVGLKHDGTSWKPMWQWCCGGQTTTSGRTFQIAQTATISSNQDDYAYPNGTLLEANVTADADLTGIVGLGVDGQMIEIQNVGTNDLTLKHESGSSSAANQISTSTGSDHVVKPKETVALKYNLAATKWYLLWCCGGGVTQYQDYTSTGFGSSYTITTDDAWEDTGMSVSLPTAGEFLVWATIHGQSNIGGVGGGGAASKIMARLYNVTDAAAVTDSEALVVWNENKPWTMLGSVNDVYGSGTILALVEGPCTIRLEVLRNANADWVLSVIVNDGTSGRTVLGYTLYK